MPWMAYDDETNVSMLEDRSCQFIIRTTGPRDITSWYALWGVGVALAGVCTRQGKEGVETKIG